MPPQHGRLDEIYELVKENNRMLHKMRRAAFWNGVWRFIWFLVIVGAPFLLYYYFLQPYIDQFLSAYQQIQSGAEKVQNFSVPQELQELLKRFGIGA